MQHVPLAKRTERRTCWAKDLLCESLSRMKGNSMSENSKIDQQLSEEQLKAITGGAGACPNCTADHARVEALLSQAHTSATHAMNAALQKDRQTEQMHLETKNRLMAEAQGILDGIATRHGYPDTPTGQRRMAQPMHPPAPRPPANR